MNVIAQVEFIVAYYDSAVLPISDYTSFIGQTSKSIAQNPNRNLQIWWPSNSYKTTQIFISCCEPSKLAQDVVIITLYKSKGKIWHIQLPAHYSTLHRRKNSLKDSDEQASTNYRWCNCYRRRKWTRRHEFKSWTRMIAFHIALTPLGKVWIQLFSLQLWVNSRTD